MTSFASQRRLIENADEMLRQPEQGGRFETACVVCARRFWREQLKLLILFQDPSDSGESKDSAVEAVASGQQERLCRLLGVQRYSRRWPKIPLEELLSSSVEHPYCKGEHLLLHKRRMPVDLKDPCLVCTDCKGSLMSSILTLPRHSLANDLWMGEQPAALRGLASATKRLLPMTRACMQVVVLQPAHLSQEERQHGFVGNTIFLPQAKPSSVLTTLPPKDVDMQDAVLFVLVGSKKDKLKGSALLRAPRDQYTAAVDCLRRTNPFYAEVVVRDADEDLLEGCVLETAEESALAQELLQKGPADAQGQEASEDEEQDGAGEEKQTKKDASPGRVFQSVCFFLWRMLKWLYPADRPSAVSIDRFVIFMTCPL